MNLTVTKEGVVKPVLTPEQKKIKKMSKEIKELRQQVNYLLALLNIKQEDIEKFSAQL